MDDNSQRRAARIATASDRRRRHTERTLHDGVQQHLALLALKLALLRGEIRRSPETAEALCAELAENLAGAQRELRELAHWLYPAVLENEGLAAALQDAAARLSLPASVTGEGVGRQPADVEATTYFCCLEVLEVAEHHGESAEELALTLIADTDGVAFTVDHIACEESELATELGYVADRLSAVGGRLTVGTGTTGTTVSGQIPLPG